MKGAVPLDEARDDSMFGSKAVGLGEAARAGLRVPPGIALCESFVEAVAGHEQWATEELEALVRPLGGPLAVRSSAIDEDSAEASFAGQHLTLLNVSSAGEVSSAVREVWWSANSDSAITYRQRVGMFTRPRVGVVVQALLDPESAGVMFTRNPVDGSDERVVEASWGIGESVVAGRVIPDHFRLARSGETLQRTPGTKKLALRTLPSGGTVEEEVPPHLAEQWCLDDGQLEDLQHLAGKCEEVYGPDRDIEWAFADGELYLLQCRAITRAGSTERVALPAPAEILPRTRLFSGLEKHDIDKLAALFKERRFGPGETVIKEGSGGAAFYVIVSGTATVTVEGKPHGILQAGDYFGEIALIDQGVRSATVTATSGLICQGLTLWEFRPLVEKDGRIAWTLLENLARELRAAEKALTAHHRAEAPALG